MEDLRNGGRDGDGASMDEDGMETGMESRMGMGMGVVSITSAVSRDREEVRCVQALDDEVRACEQGERMGPCRGDGGRHTDRHPPRKEIQAACGGMQ